MSWPPCKIIAINFKRLQDHQCYSCLHSIFSRILRAVTLPTSLNHLLCYNQQWQKHVCRWFLKPKLCITTFLQHAPSFGRLVYYQFYLVLFLSVLPVPAWRMISRSLLLLPSSFVTWGPLCVPVPWADCTSLYALDGPDCHTWWIPYERAYNHVRDTIFFFLFWYWYACLVFTLPLWLLDAHLLSFVLVLDCLHFSSYSSVLSGSQISLLSHIALPQS